MTSIASSLPSAFSSLRRHSTHLQAQPPDYMVVDSQNQHEQEIQKMPRKSSVAQCQAQLSNLQPSSVYLLVPDHLQEKNVNIDDELQQAEKQIKKLQKQCQFFENLINDMVAQQAQIQVELHSRHRKKYNQTIQGIPAKQCPVHNPISQLNYQSMAMKPSKTYNLLDIQSGVQSTTQSRTYINTPQISRNQPLVQMSQNKGKTVDINEYLSKVTVKAKQTNRKKTSKPTQVNNTRKKVKSCVKCNNLKRVV